MSSELNFEKPADIKVILLGDSAVGKSKLIERFLLNDFVPHQLSTYALTLYRHTCAHPSKKGKQLTVEFWDTAGQERFHSMHPSYYISAHACILCFDMTRKITYKNLDTWYDQLTAYRGITVPIIIVANKVDMDPNRARKSFGFIERRREERRIARKELGARVDEDEVDMPLFLCSASDGTNVVAAFKDAIRRAVEFKEGGEVGGTFVDEILSFIREEESVSGGLFSKDKNSGGVGSGSVDLDDEDHLSKKFGSEFSVDDQSTLRGSSGSVYAGKTNNRNGLPRTLDSDDEEEILAAKNLARVKEMRKANIVAQ
ncbi:UNVERIFIED_CONTAM: Rab-like protein 2A [Siphonaria sp. JEL0065]|nr:Rab-like protein 2A [Siphonaria sp. JEL0065]